MEHVTVTVNRSKVRRVTRNGRTYLVAPMTLLVPGVLNGSEGPLYYPQEEIAAHPGQWNDVPIVVYHPTDPTTNSPVSGRDPAVLDRVKVGRVYGDRVTKNGRRRAEGWFDEERTRAVDPRVWRALVEGTPLELSTGLFTRNEPTGGTHNGKGYTAVARDYRPDHLAVLPDQVGACSIRDGCGVLVNAVPPSVYVPRLVVNTLAADWESHVLTLNDENYATPYAKKECECGKPDGECECAKVKNTWAPLKNHQSA